MVERLILNRVLRETKFVEISLKLLISAFLKVHVDLIDEIRVEFLVIDLVVGQEFEDVKFLRLAVVLEEIGVVWNQTVGIGCPLSEYI